MGDKKDLVLDIPLTIERQLENYSKREGHTDRHETLWHAWYQNKRWISQLLQIILYSFPTYSRHDETHALSVLNNIEMILGEERISELSATDCFVLLHTVYIHDIGMCITQQDRKDIIENEEFIEMIEKLQEEGDESLKRAVECLKRTDYQYGDSEEHLSQMRQLYRAKLDVYYAILELIATYRRHEHSTKSAERLYDWTMKPDKLKTGFSMAGVPLRIFLSIAQCAQMHTCGNFDDIKKLPKKDGGYASDYYHPRFISVLLMLGDLLDMDNDRFHPMVFEFVEDFPETSRNHYDKHRAIKRLHISPSKIEIEADCESQNALRLVRKECDMLADILLNAGYMWSDICPAHFRGSLPSLGDVNLYLKGKQIPEELVTAQFRISQKKAFSILEGSNLYEGRFVFLREFLQNAIDASKMQYWYDYTGMVSFYYGDDLIRGKSPHEMNQELPMDKYPVEVCMRMQKRDAKGKNTDISQEDIQQIESDRQANFEYGILVSIKDFGTGIDKDSIIAISKVGNSRLKDYKVIQKMPEWLRPTAEFGVGLQSAFLLTESFKCYTHTRSGERYEITFNSGSSYRHEGYINVIPNKKMSGRYEAYGTLFEVFVPLKRKFLHSESISTWSGSDPFSEDYDQKRPFRHAAELISQMAIYLDGMLGELLFPIILKIDTQSILQLELNSRKGNAIEKMVYCSENDWRRNYKKSWIFQYMEKSSKFLYGETQNIIFALEYDTFRLYLWNKDIHSFCAVSGSNLLKKEEEYRKDVEFDATKRGITVYYKGIELQHRCIKEEIDMFEYIDIKGDLERSYININRRGFTAEGSKYFENQIYYELLHSSRIVLKYINHLINDNETERQLCRNITGKIEDLAKWKRAEETLNENSYEKAYYDKLMNLADQLLTLSFLSHLALKDVKDEMSNFGRQCGQEEPCVWQNMIKEVCRFLDNRENKVVKDELKKCSTLFNIECYTYTKDKCMLKNINILEFFLQNRHYGIFRERKNKFGRWTSYIISIDQKDYEQCEKAAFYDYNSGKKNRDSLNKWSDKLFEITANIGETVSEEHKYEQQFLLAWFAKNMPIIGVISNQDGNKRFNILSNYIFPCVYTNENHKLLIVQRILETATEQEICRFSTYAWQDRQHLAVKEAPFSCFFVMRGYFNKASLYKVIFPLDKQILNDAEKILKNVEKLEFVKDVRLLNTRLDCKAYFARLVKEYNRDNSSLNSKEKAIMDKLLDRSEKCKKSITSIIFDMSEFLIDIIKSVHEKKSLEENYFEMLKACENEWYDCYDRIMDIYLDLLINRETGAKVKELKKDGMLQFISRGWWFVHGDFNIEEIPNHLQIAKLRDTYLLSCRTDPVIMKRNEKIINYIFEHARYPIRKEGIERCFAAFIEEIFELLETLEKRNVQKVLKDILVDKDIQRTIK